MGKGPGQAKFDSYLPNGQGGIQIFFEPWFRCEEILLGGDFNLVRDVTKDKKGGKSTTHRNSLRVIQNIWDNLDLTNI